LRVVVIQVCYMPEPKKRHHVIVELRRIIDQKQINFAPFIGCSVHTLQSVETGRLNLSPRVAQKIADKTGVDPSWLLKNEAGSQIRTRYGEIFSKETFEEHSKSRRADSSWEIVNIHHGLAEAFSWLCQAYLGAAQKGQIALLQFRLNELCADLSERFPISSHASSCLTHAIASQIKPIKQLAPLLSDVFAQQLAEIFEDEFGKQSARNRKIDTIQLLNLYAKGFLKRQSSIRRPVQSRQYYSPASAQSKTKSAHPSPKRARGKTQK
jgi:DNA-binding XRE family transcriptional regulator